MLFEAEPQTAESTAEPRAAHPFPQEMMPATTPRVTPSTPHIARMGH